MLYEVITLKEIYNWEVITLKVAEAYKEVIENDKYATTQKA